MKAITTDLIAYLVMIRKKRSESRCSCVYMHCYHMAEEAYNLVSWNEAQPIELDTS